ncbi:MAG: YdeI/OmpD-associated family protein [Candidatus Omnitrophica bacterium]|nr:YdeI/OmpD-associated family protein [Candidatus Omnitrophota bacterium]MBU1047328.1 YdeI/OmpD-associated family protein [Candidatus Omnitrophota bacterium]MBU1630655.1 YdeI/OmpD-associated family protein [Candidatus Omnitrophota bacterium]MBU1767766.1 YdeI/OmpD-associated family protein [Candidatus Omnitrophota bacterium]MBU1889087.1 YdeI/OmpD-associated family protein [Candidatus Omnitrophota bacterium]
MLYITTRKEWRNWLKKHFKTESEVWLVYYKKGTGKPRIQYNDAVEEALCFGWIDSIVRKLDDKSFAQRFSRRSLKSKYSQANKVRLRSLVKQKKVQKEVLESLGTILEEKYVIPNDILLAIKVNKLAWKNFQKYSPQYQEIRIAFIDGARKRPNEFSKRLKYFIKMTEKNKVIGFGGINKHY